MRQRHDRGEPSFSRFDGLILIAVFAFILFVLYFSGYIYVQKMWTEYTEGLLIFALVFFALVWLFSPRDRGGSSTKPLVVQASQEKVNHALKDTKEIKFLKEVRDVSLRKISGHLVVLIAATKILYNNRNLESKELFQKNLLASKRPINAIINIFATFYPSKIFLQFESSMYLRNPNLTEFERVAYGASEYLNRILNQVLLGKESLFGSRPKESLLTSIDAFEEARRVLLLLEKQPVIGHSKPCLDHLINLLEKDLVEKSAGLDLSSLPRKLRKKVLFIMKVRDKHLPFLERELNGIIDSITLFEKKKYPLKKRRKFALSIKNRIQKKLVKRISYFYPSRTFLDHTSSHLNNHSQRADLSMAKYVSEFFLRVQHPLDRILNSYNQYDPGLSAENFLSSLNESRKYLHMVAYSHPSDYKKTWLSTLIDLIIENDQKP